jgi:hypothetical protein
VTGGNASCGSRLFCADQESDIAANRFQYVGRRRAHTLCATSCEVDRFDLIGENHPGDLAGVGKSHFERIALKVARDRANETETSAAIVSAFRDDERWAPTGLLVADPWIQVQFDEVAWVRSPRSAHQISRPCGWPHSVSLWRFLRVMRARRSSSGGCATAERRTMTPGASTSKCTLSPSRKLAFCITALGMRTAGALPHLRTVRAGSELAFMFRVYTSVSTRRFAIRFDEGGYGGLLVEKINRVLCGRGRSALHSVRVDSRPKGNTLNYMPAPLGDHYDGGFGAMGLSFSHAAQVLMDAQKGERNILLAHMPVNFLLRHSIELYLKSGIVILHRRLHISFGESQLTLQPGVPVRGEWKPLYKLHSVADLYVHWKNLIESNVKQLRAMSRLSSANWSIPKELDEAVALIEATDSRSTYYRYPDLRDEKANAAKSNFKEIAVSDLFTDTEPEQKPAMILAVTNEAGEFVRTFMLDDDTEKLAAKALLFAKTALDEFHAMMRYELTGGW